MLLEDPFGISFWTSEDFVQGDGKLGERAIRSTLPPILMEEEETGAEICCMPVCANTCAKYLW